MAILFDLDDTLLDDLAAKNHYMPKLYSHFKILIQHEESVFFTRWKEAIPKYYKMYTHGLMTFEQQRRERVREAFGNPNLTDKIVLDVVEAFDNYFKEGWQPFHNTIEILDYFINVKLGMVTNGSSKQQNDKIDTLGIREYFNCIVISGEEQFAKPDERIFLKACNTMGCDPSECTFIGDSWKSDVLGSNKCGMTSVWFNRYGKELPEKLERFHMITDLGDLKNIIREN